MFGLGRRWDICWDEKVEDLYAGMIMEEIIYLLG
jgi:hypothetical protein